MSSNSNNIEENKSKTIHIKDEDFNKSITRDSDTVLDEIKQVEKLKNLPGELRNSKNDKIDIEICSKDIINTVFDIKINNDENILMLIPDSILSKPDRPKSVESVSACVIAKSSYLDDVKYDFLESIKNDACIVTNVKVESTTNKMQIIDVYTCNPISNPPQKKYKVKHDYGHIKEEITYDGFSPFLNANFKKTYNKLYTMFKYAHDNNYEHLILSAFGCGGKNNPPYAIACIFKHLIKYFADYKFNNFKSITFSITDDATCDIFKRVFNQK